ncbi:MAG TPA: VOC family protein [Alphaproteobacteria bacterium]|nr:VOC family protein [Alphaproteobacteria bacterium]
MSVDALLSYALSVPDPEAGRLFYASFGLIPDARGAVIAFRCEGRDQDQVHLVEGRRKRLHHLAFGTSLDGLTAIAQRMAARGIPEIDPPHPAFNDGLWLRDPDGNAICLLVEAARPWRTAPPVRLNTPGHMSRIGIRGAPDDHPVRPTRLGHVLLHTPRLEAMLAFYGEVLGLRLSDRVDGMIAFMHLPTGGDHHVLAFLADARPGFHHASFEVASPDEIGIGARRVLEAGYRDGWGLGRHVLGSNFFHYLRDPWHSLAEYFCDIDQIPPDGSWRAADHPPADALYRWGPPPPPDFGTNFEA